MLLRSHVIQKGLNLRNSHFLSMPYMMKID